MELTNLLSFLVRNFNSRGVREYVIWAIRIRFFPFSQIQMKLFVSCTYFSLLSICSVKIQNIEMYASVARPYRKVNMFMILYLSDCSRLKCIWHHCNRRTALHFNLFGCCSTYNSRASKRLFALKIKNMAHSLTHVTIEC